MPKVSIIIPHYNRLGFLISNLESIIMMNRGFDYEILVIDNGSYDGTKSWFKYMQRIEEPHEEFGYFWGFGDRIKYTRLSTNTGDHEAKKLGLSKAKGDYLMTWDNDLLQIENDWLAKMVEMYDYLHEHHGVGAIGGRCWLVRQVMPLLEKHEIEFSFGKVVCGPVQYAPTMFYKREHQVPNLPHIGRRDLVKGDVWKVMNLTIYENAYGTGSLSRSKDDPMYQKYGWGDSGHRYLGYFRTLKKTPGCERLEDMKRGNVS